MGHLGFVCPHSLQIVHFLPTLSLDLLSCGLMSLVFKILLKKTLKPVVLNLVDSMAQELLMARQAASVLPPSER